MKIIIIEVEENPIPKTGHLLTNFSSSKLPLYQKAIEIYEAAFGDNTLFIGNDPRDCNGRRVDYSLELRATECKDRSKFWNIFRILEK